MFRGSLNTRLYISFLGFILFFSILAFRLVYVQIFKAAQYQAFANDQHSIFTEIQPLRGIIFDRNLTKLTVNTTAYSIFATSEFTAEPERLAQLAGLIGLDSRLLAKKLETQKGFIWLGRQVSPEISVQLKGLNLSGIGQVREWKRFYPNGSLASHILGFTNIDNQGIEGLEFYLNSYLSGIKGWRLAQRDAKKEELICWGYQSILPTDGYNLVLTLDSVIQNIAERQLRQAAQKYKARSATAIVMRPASGEILALCNYPDYDANNFQEYDQGQRRNLAITDLFEPGSSFKFVTAAAALEENKAKPEDRFFCENGNYQVGGRILHDYRPYGWLSFREVIEHSSNIGTVKVAQRLGAESLYKYIKAFGFGSLTGIDLPGEAKGIIYPPKKWSRSSMSAIPMGQGIAITPLQLITAMSCIANNGILVKPKIIQSIQLKDGKVIKSFPAEETRRVISGQTAVILKQFLTGVVERGTGTAAQVSGYKTAGKTGTAQKANPQGGYFQNKYCASFVGFVPADRPEVAILVVLNEPYPLYFGGTVCAPVFKNIATETLHYLEMTNQINLIQAHETKGTN